VEWRLEARPIAQFAERDEVLGTVRFGEADDDVVQHLDFEELAGADQVARDLDVRLRRGRVAAGMIVLCEVPIYVQ